MQQSSAPPPRRALVIGDGPSYHSVANTDWSQFDGFIVSTHYYRHKAGAVVSIDPKLFDQKERHALGKARLVIGMSHWANSINLKRFIPKTLHSQIEWEWCDRPVLTSGIFAIEWAARAGFNEIYTLGIDLTPGYHRRLDTQRHVLAHVLGTLKARGVSVYKGSQVSTLPVAIRNPAEFLPTSAVRPATRLPVPHAAAAPGAPRQRKVLLRPRGKRPRVVLLADK